MYFLTSNSDAGGWEEAIFEILSSKILEMNQPRDEWFQRSTWLVIKPTYAWMVVGMPGSLLGIEGPGLAILLTPVTSLHWYCWRVFPVKYWLVSSILSESIEGPRGLSHLSMAEKQPPWPLGTYWMSSGFSADSQIRSCPWTVIT